MYEHIVVFERFTKRHIKSDEDIHHLDGNRANNRIENLLAIEHGQHTKLHNWLKSGCPGRGSFCDKTDDGERNAHYVEFCSCCGQTLQSGQEKFCSKGCSAIGRRKIKNRPTKSQLRKDMERLSWLAIGRKYGVTDNAVRKWARQVGLFTTKKLVQVTAFNQ